jgi:4'-phosphopantetheinyl transferase
MVVYPVIMGVPSGTACSRGRSKTAALSALAREALTMSASQAGLELAEMCQDDRGRPLASNGCWWSVSHKPRYVAAVAARARTGIDIEEVRPRKESTFRYVASEDEWALCAERSWQNLFRLWTAKEAVVKAAGHGLSGLRSCEVVALPDESTVFLYFDNRLYEVAQLSYDGHLASVVKNDDEVHWVTPDTRSNHLS